MDTVTLKAEIAALNAETVKLQAEMVKLRAEKRKLEAEGCREVFWYPVAIAAGLIGAVAGVTMALARWLA